MARTIWISDDKKRDAQVGLEAPPKATRVRYVTQDDHAVKSERLIRSTEHHTYDALKAKIGDGEVLAKALAEGDPEVDLHNVGRRVGDADRVYVDADGKLVYSARTLLVVYDQAGAEKSRADFVDVEANVTEEAPLPWSGRLMPIDEVVRKYVLARALQLRHVNGLTFDFLFGIAKALHEQKKLLLVGSGQKGIAPLIMQRNGTPYRGFLEGRVDGEKYLLVLHLSNLELKAAAS
ncbi:MAG: hypothetical protein QM765_08130 [Myxococcales bacterium]